MKSVNKSLTQAKFLQPLKIESVGLLLKGKGLPTIPQNYRPISCQYFISKVMKTVVL